MEKILVGEESERDAIRLEGLLKQNGLTVTVCSSGSEVAGHLNGQTKHWAAIMILWELHGPPFGPELVARARRLLPAVPIVVLSGALDATLATRAFGLGANDFLEKPLDAARVKSCLESLLTNRDSDSKLLVKLNERVLGNSPALLSTLRQTAKVIRHGAPRVLLIGESGTGKELLAHAIHDLSPNPVAPFVAVNVAAIPKDLIESALFGHEKGAFTGATDLHRGYMEEAEAGTLFLDEFGELELSVQAKLLRAIQEKRFRRLKGNKEIDFQARLVCATNRDLALDVKQGAFRRDLFHRIAEVTIHVPALHERAGDLDLLLEHFLSQYAADRRVKFERETLTILHTYSFPGNVRELQNLVKRALIESDGESVLPQHLPLPTMGAFLAAPDPTESSTTVNAGGQQFQELWAEVLHALPQNWQDLPYKQVLEQYQRAFDRVYFTRLIERHRHNVTKATKVAGVDKKTFAQHWKMAGLPPLRFDEDERK